MSLVLLSTKEAIFLFDVLALGEKFIFDSESPLRNILEDSGIMKVLHDSRIICDLLHHKYQVTLSNVYDTLAAHTVFGTYAIYAGYMPKHTFPFTDLVRFIYILTYSFVYSTRTNFIFWIVIFFPSIYYFLVSFRFIKYVQPIFS